MLKIAIFIYQDLYRRWRHGQELFYTVAAYPTVNIVTCTKRTLIVCTKHCNLEKRTEIIEVEVWHHILPCYRKDYVKSSKELLNVDTNVQHTSRNTHMVVF